VPTQYDTDSGVLTISHTPECDAVQYAYFAPYTYNRHRQLIARTQVGSLVHLFFFVLLVVSLLKRAQAAAFVRPSPM
jgi:predicted secreted protein